MAYDSYAPAGEQGPPPKSRARTVGAAIGLAICITVVLFATMWPTPLDQGYSESINRVLDVLHRNGIPEWFGYDKLEFSANVLMFLPIGFLIALLLPAQVWWLAFLICPILSGSIELTQANFLSARFATITDVIANSIGATIGAVLAGAILALVHTRDEKIIARALWESGYRR